MSGDSRIPGFGGRLTTPANPDFELARLTNNAAWDARPGLIARAADAKDVAAVVRWARATDQVVAIRSGGHSIAGHSTGDGVAVLDLAALDGIEFDAAAATAWVGPGVTAGAFTKAAFERGRAVSFGDTGTVGLGGLIPGGGIGWLVRKYGLTIDSLLAAEVVTADGEVLTVDAEREPDLFWALRGGGGNFGVVTRYRLALNPIGEVLHGTLLMPADRDTIQAVLSIGAAAPDDLTLMPLLMAIPPMDEVPPSEHGKLGLWVDTLWAGSVDSGQGVLAALRGVGRVLMDNVEQKPYPQIYPAPSGRRSAWTASSIYLDEFSAGAVDTMTALMSNGPPGENLVQIRILGGAAGRARADATAYGWRGRRFLAWIISDAPDTEPFDQALHTGWVSEFRAALAAYGSGCFMSFTAADDLASVAACYPPDTLARLREIKRRWDPDNLFRHNHNIAPADGVDTTE